MNRRRFLSLASVGVAGGVLTACGNDPEATNLTPTRVTDAINAPTLAANATPPSGETAGGSEPAAGGAGVTEASIETEDIKFSTTALSIAANTDVKITVTNKGVLQHDFHVDKLNITSKLLSSGETDTVTINAAPGTYDYWCTVPGHKEAGMVGKLTVGGEGGGASEEASPASEQAPAAAGATSAEISTVDINFEPKELTIAAGTDVKITVTNKGVLQHDFHVDKLDITSKLLNGGETDTVTINAPAGTYDFWCTVPGHKEAGMKGTLTIVGAGGGAAPAAGGESAPAADTSAPAASAGGGGATTASVDTIDINFEPKELTIAAGTDVKITVTNKGVLQHDFHVDKLNITSKLLSGGDTDTVTVNTAAGTYDFWCTVPGHKEAGMVGKLIVK